MTAFNDIKSQWEEQPQVKVPADGSKIIVKKINNIKKKQRIANVVLLTTAIILIWFFYYVNAYSNALVTFALGLMIAVLLIRVILEYVSIKKLNQLDVTTNAIVFKTAMTSYYKKRIITHYIITPIIMLLYITGFIILLPFFKESLSTGFYNYIIVSALIILGIMVLGIGKQIKKELQVLKQMKQK